MDTKLFSVKITSSSLSIWRLLLRNILFLFLVLFVIDISANVAQRKFDVNSKFPLSNEGRIVKREVERRQEPTSTSSTPSTSSSSSFTTSTTTTSAATSTTSTPTTSPTTTSKPTTTTISTTSTPTTSPTTTSKPTTLTTSTISTQTGSATFTTSTPTTSPTTTSKPTTTTISTTSTPTTSPTTTSKPTTLTTSTISTQTGSATFTSSTPTTSLPFTTSRLSSFITSVISFPETCGASMTCIASPYRTIDGTCNNLYNPFWGSSNRYYNRFLAPDYEDGFQSPRGKGRSPPLPRSRDVSVAMTNTLLPPSPDEVTLMLMQWGQFTDHDLVATRNDAGPATIYGGTFCCNDFIDSTQTSPSCLPINVTGDPFYSSHNVQCLPFVRSAQSQCFDREREQINEQTAYLDASQVYGANADVAFEVREFNSWRLRSGPGNENCSAPCLFDFLPVRNNFRTFVTEFFAGDERVEEQPGLTSIHTLFVRMHNDLGQVLRNKHPEYSNDQVYEETRKIIIAVMQQITFEEFLPVVLGNSLMDQYQLTLQPVDSADPFFNDYNPLVDATIANVFPTAAYRFGHSLIADMFKMPNGDNVSLAESFNNHQRTQIPGTFPSHFLTGISTEPAQEMDHVLASAVQNFLLATHPFQFGSDLYARNIERGRDHGIPAYIHWVNLCKCHSKPIKRLEDVLMLMPAEVALVFENLYRNRLWDIDLFPAGIAEHKVPGGLIGSTFACILSEVFHRLKLGDRYWFENPNVFTKAQLKSIRNTKLSTIICKYTDAPELQEYVMRNISQCNPLICCCKLHNRGVIADISVNW